MRTIGTVFLATVLVASVAYLIADNLILKRQMPRRIEKTYIISAFITTIIGFALYLAGK